MLHDHRSNHKFHQHTVVKKVMRYGEKLLKLKALNNFPLAGHPLFRAHVFIHVCSYNKN